LSTDPAGSITFEEEPDEAKGIQGKKKVSLVDYFYAKVSHRAKHLRIVQSSSSTTWVALHYRQEEHVLADGGISVRYIALILGL